MNRKRSTKELKAIHAKRIRPPPTRKPASKAHRVGKYVLHEKRVKFAGGERTIRFYAMGRSKKGKPAPMPEGFKAVVSKNGVPFVARRDRAQESHLEAMARA